MGFVSFLSSLTRIAWGVNTKQLSAFFSGVVSCLESPESTHVIAAFKAGRHHALVQTSLDAGQTAGAGPDHCDFVHHDAAACRKGR